MKTKFPFADTLKHLAVWGFGDIMKQSFQEGPDSTKKLMGTGAYTLDSYSPPTTATFKKFPGYHTAPLGYFDSIEWAPRLDYVKGIADVIGKNVNFSYWYPESDRDQIKKGRPDLQAWSYDVGAEAVRVRTDKAPWNDIRVRQALSMAIDRKPLIQALTQGEGEADQYLSWAGTYWGFRKPKDLGANAKYYEQNLTEVKALMTAAGITAPIKAKAQHWNATVIGQKFVDQFTQIKAAWKSAGIADITSEEMTHPQLSSGPLIGNYDDMFWFPNILGIQAQLGLNMLLQLSWGGQPHAAPTFNLGWVDDKDLDALLNKQLGEFDKNARLAVFRSIEDYMAQKQYAIVGITHKTTYFGDPKLRNAQAGQEAYNGALPYFKYWWYDKA
jgi:ABC-type transport system substrate-binding protein